MLWKSAFKQYYETHGDACRLGWICVMLKYFEPCKKLSEASVKVFEKLNNLFLFPNKLRKNLSEYFVGAPKTLRTCWNYLRTMKSMGLITFNGGIWEISELGREITQSLCGESHDPYFLTKFSPITEVISLSNPYVIYFLHKILVHDDIFIELGSYFNSKFEQKVRRKDVFSYFVESYRVNYGWCRHMLDTRIWYMIDLGLIGKNDKILEVKGHTSLYSNPELYFIHLKYTKFMYLL